MEGNLVETLFEAITVGDEQQVELCLKSATIATVLEFESVYGESPLHLCVKLGGVSHLGLVRRLLASGLVDFDQRDNEGQTVLEYAYQSGDQELTKQLIGVEIEGLDDATACYKMMKHDSLDLFKLFLSMKNMSEDETFKNIASAFAKLNVKNFVLSKELRLFAQWKLSDYAYRNLSGNWPGVKDPAEWKIHVDNIDDCWLLISAKYDTRLYDDVDDQLLHRLHVIHNYLYFLKHKQFLNHLPMHEIVFCVAMFISVFKSSAQSDEYRLLVNKRLVMDFVRMIHRQLKLAKKHLEIVEKELSTIMQEAQQLDSHTKNRLIEVMLEKLKATNFPNKDHWIAETTKKIYGAEGSNKDVLIKDLIKKIKSSDKMHLSKAVQAIDEENKRHLIDEICKRGLHVTHPQNVANRLIAGWKKGKTIDATVVETVGEESIDLRHLLRGKDRRIIRKIKTCYTKMKQIYSLHKALHYCKEINLDNELETNASLDSVTLVACTMRMIQVFGEAIKNTQNSPNLPGKAKSAVERMLSALFPLINISLRETISHSVSFKRILVDEACHRKVFETSKQNLRTVYISFLLLYVVALIEARQSFYGLMRRCGSYEALRSLLLYADDAVDMERQQLTFFETIKKYFYEAQTLFTALRGSFVGKSLEFVYLHKQMERKIAIVADLEKFFNESSNFTYVDVRRACFVGDDLAATQRLLDWKLTMRWANKFFSSIRSEWDKQLIHTYQLEWMDPRLLKFSPSVLAGVLKIIATAMDCAEQFDYLWHTRKLIQELGLTGSFDANATQELNQRLKPYYDNIFVVESKWRIVKTFCNSRNIELNERLVHELTNSDQEKLQALFDDRRKKLRTILEKHGMDTVENLANCMRNLPPSAEAGLEYLQLELCEMLVAVGYFGDNFQYLKHRMPMIQGRNYRNYLAHDSLSYNLLTDSWTEKIVINAYVIAYTELHLFGKREALKIEVTEMSYPKVQATHRWMEEQSQMIGAFQTEDLNQIVAAIKNGGEIRSVFCCSPNQKKAAPQFRNLNVLVDSCNVDPLMVQYLNTYFYGFAEVCGDPVHQLETALVMCNYQAAFDRTIGSGPARDTLIRNELFGWPELMLRVRKTDLFRHLVAAFNRQRILKALIEHGNERGVREILPFFEDFRDPTQLGPLRDALLYNLRSIAELLVPRTTGQHVAVELLLIIIHWNDMFPTVVLRSEMCSEKLQLLLKTAAQSRNYTASVFLLENELFKQHLPGAFSNSCIHAARMGETSLLQHLLEIHPATSQELAEIVHQAAVRKRWKCVSLLLDRDAPVDIEFPGKNSEESHTLFILVKFGLWRLIDRVRSVHCRMYGDNIKHPFSTAIGYGMMSGGMVRTLRRLGFDWLDSSMILHAAILRRDNAALANIWREIDVILQSNHLEIEDSRFAFAVKVFTTWQTIGFVEESTSLETSLICAIENKDKDMIKELLDRAKSMRHLEGIGILDSIVFKTSTSIVCFGKRDENRIGNVQKCCKDMIMRLKISAVLDMGWQEFMIDLGVPVQFYVLSANDEKIQPSPESADVNLRKSGSLLDSLNDFMTVSNELFAEASVIVANFKLSGGTSVYFCQVEDISCIYNILPAGAEIDLSATVNYRHLLGETPLHKCFPNDELATVKMLVEAGANPLLADRSGMAAIHVSLWNSKDYAVARYFVDVCQDRELRNEHGVSLVDLEDGNMKNRLIHIAVMTGRRDIVERLLQLKVDVSVINSIGFTPIQTALNVSLPNNIHMVKLLLDYDSSSINAIDSNGDTLLFRAIKYHSVEVLQEILRHDPDITLTRKDVRPFL
ncbi:AGAP010934-PA-like protein [Anopheles sinensis]|uniref:AGAP010934-PA-like protein n=1 Tax=Anopheles sinensis TaxID=74873 RepID=A0A084VSI8_ANOSI|nr:AGAP010934-PA-like protein [Anopheles sinensis]